jgi:hypothetical protein
LCFYYELAQVFSFSYYLCHDLFKATIQMVIQDLSVLDAVVYTFARRMSGLFF